MKKILVATEFSAPSENALKSVAKWIKAASGIWTVVLLKTYKIAPGTPSDRVIEENDRIKVLAQELLAEEREFLLRELEGKSVRVEAGARMGSIHNIVGQMLAKDDFEAVAVFKDNEGFREINQIFQGRKLPALVPIE